MVATDPLAALRATAQRGSRNSQYRVSVSPHAVLELFRRHDELAAALGVKERTVAVPHEHSRRSGDIFTHSHSRGDIPHGHHGARYESRPKVEL